MAENEIEISELELADELLKDMVFPVETATDTKAATLLQLKKWLGTALPVGFILPAVGKINDSRFTLLDGKTLAKNGAYREFCEKVVEQVQGGNWFACSQEEYDADLLAYGQCGRFVVENDYIRIPKLTRFMGATVTLSEIGKSFAQSLPQHTHTRGTMNITGKMNASWEYDATQIATGAFTYKKEGDDNESPESAAGAGGQVWYFDASRSWTGSTSGASDDSYKEGAKVQPDHVKYPYYMVIGSEGQKEEISVDINNVYEDINLKADRATTLAGYGITDAYTQTQTDSFLNTKANTSANNFSSAGKQILSALSMPSKTKYTDLTLGASGAIYTAPATGWFLIDKSANDQEYVYIGSNLGVSFTLSSSGSQGICATIPVPKGKAISISYNASRQTNRFRFIYAIGEE